MNEDADQTVDTQAELARLDELTRLLRRECPWDREQDERSIVSHAVEEAYELAAAAYAGDDAELLDELGDVLCSVFFVGLLMEERGVGSVTAAAKSLREKLIRRHPHIFGSEETKRDLSASNEAEVLSNWDQIKRVERGQKAEVFAEVPEVLPGPLYARKFLRQAASSGFDFDHVPYETVTEELAELEAASGREDRFHEVGDLLFAGVNVARKLKVDPELALRAAAERFRRRVDAAAELSSQNGIDWNGASSDQQLNYYTQVRGTNEQ